MGSDRQNAAG